MDVLIVVVNYRSRQLVLDCLKTLEPEIRGYSGRAKVVVTDNASGDGSAEALIAAVRENGWDSWVEIKPLDSNGGFAYGNNAAIRPALTSNDPPRFVWMLNPDTLVRPVRLRRCKPSSRAGPMSGSPERGSKTSTVARSSRSSHFRPWRPSLKA